MKVLIPLLVALAVVARCQPPPGTAAEAPRVTAETLVGTWSGHWASESSAARGSAELVLARVPGRDDVIGQFTFVMGGTTRSLRYEGRIDNGALRFPLVGDGRIVLEPDEAARVVAAQRLRGEWKDARGALPAPRGLIDLSRVR
jgi:hypothetical protein